MPETKVTNVFVSYCSNYNGCSLEVNGEPTAYGDAAFDAITDEIVEYAADMCSNDGEFYGDIDELEEFAIDVVKRHLGADVVVTFEEDASST